MTCSAGSFTGSDCCPIFAPLLATMDYQPSLPQPAASVSQALTQDTPVNYDGLSTEVIVIDPGALDLSDRSGEINLSEQTGNNGGCWYSCNDEVELHLP